MNLSELLILLRADEHGDIDLLGAGVRIHHVPGQGPAQTLTVLIRRPGHPIEPCIVSDFDWCRFCELSVLTPIATALSDSLRTALTRMAMRQPDGHCHPQPQEAPHP